MAHFARLDADNTVVDVVVVDNADTLDADGNEDETVGEAFLQQLLGTTDTFKQTSYNNSFRVRYALIGGKYDATNDCFWTVKKYPSWVANYTTMDWEAPVPMPQPQNANGTMKWDEDTQTWFEQVRGDA